jgi:DNA-binding response OmpR family regulator
VAPAIVTIHHIEAWPIGVERELKLASRKALPSGIAMETILLIDDDMELCTILQGYLARYGFEVGTEHSGDAGLRRALSGEFALILLDVMLPGIDGFEVLRRLRATSKVSVLLLTARGEDVDRIVGLEMGADDYLPKPFNPRELLARIRAILRRSAVNQTEPAAIRRLAVAGLELDNGARSAVCSNVELDLTNVEFDLLRALMEAPGRILTREYLSEIVLNRKFSPFDRSLDTHVCHLRRKLDDAARQGDRIKTIRSVGYQLTVSATGEIAESPAPSTPADSAASLDKTAGIGREG